MFNGSGYLVIMARVMMDGEAMFFDGA